MIKLIKCYIRTYLSFVKRDKAKIPKGMYCYSYDGENYKQCPYWVYGGRQFLAGCKYMREVDRGFLLWDSCKECGINKGLHESDLI